ncbi:MAG TPA: hypothetical protein DEA96_01580 [Leptospiraceae bacterium]|nr:hypothetical protein [Spirochaetaceae bacterium]HBS03624.1 hypothetical protein [Leptospiraceae bacterium]|tara:strand:+ start:60238 stop:61458 length:1221 start_codon:yes stop_codon:yes gene_type:complete
MPPKVLPIQPVSSTKSGIYLHFPYCLQKCHYCDFYSVGLDELGSVDFSARLDQYEQALLRELEVRSQDPQFASQNYDTVYFGGGTSSLMPPEMIHRILEALKGALSIDTESEITLEGNPENLVPDYLQPLHELGINRVNSGLQTYNAAFLKDMNRFFETDRYAGLLEALTSSAIPSVGVDLIYGFYKQTYSDFQKDLEQVLKYDVQHLSVYSLTVEPETRYARHIVRGSQGSPNESLQEEIFSSLPSMLGEHDLFQYEISNFARPGEICMHNWKYWDYRPYLGLGPGAHGFNGRQRYANPRNLNAWTAAPGSTQVREEHNAVIDVFLNLFRIALPISLDRILEIWQQEPWEDSLRNNRWNALMDEVNRLNSRGLCDLSQNFQWTPQGIALLDSHIERLIEVTLQAK